MLYPLTALGDASIDGGDKGIGVHNFFILFISSLVLIFCDEQVLSFF